MAISIAYHCLITQWFMMPMTLFSLSILLFSSPLGSASTGGFSVELIHRELSPKSPYFNPKETHYQRLYRTLSTSRVHNIQGNFLMEISIGSPPVRILGIADTGSDLIWTRCYPCKYCLNQSAPLFNPANSKSYKEIACYSSECRRIPGQSCLEDGKCGFSEAYHDGTYSEGKAARETFALDSNSMLHEVNSTGKNQTQMASLDLNWRRRTVKADELIFGCTHADGGGNYTSIPEMTGIIGLGRGSISLVSQLKVGNKFAYCLPKSGGWRRQPGKLHFGKSGVVSGHGTVSTPFVYNYGYFLTLKGATVTGAGSIAVNNSSGRRGNILIDSGSTMTYLDPSLYQGIKNGVESRIFLPPADPVEGLSLCYNISSLSYFHAPQIIMHFEGADVTLKTVNSFATVARNTACFVIQPNTLSRGINIFGSLAQINFWVGYGQGKVSFKPVRDCRKV